MAAAAPYANAITSGDATITTRGRGRLAAAYSPSMAGTILAGSIGSVRIARLIHSVTWASSRTFSSAVMPPVALVGVRTILVILRYLYGNESENHAVPPRHRSLP